jgi:4-amino-4-deoxy-L-arabinose transferase-like glycosyltransferase
VFLPFYPLLIKLFALIFKNYMLSALIVSNLSYALAAYYLYKLVLLDYPKEDAIRAVFYFSIFPTAYMRLIQRVLSWHLLSGACTMRGKKGGLARVSWQRELREL